MEKETILITWFYRSHSGDPTIEVTATLATPAKTYTATRQGITTPATAAAAISAVLHDQTQDQRRKRRRFSEDDRETIRLDLPLPGEEIPNDR